jgi:multiple antibiotic resistance protein
MWEELIRSFITLFIIIDPFMSVAFLLSYSKDMNAGQKNKAIMTAIAVAGGLLFIFLFSGLYLLDVLGISFSGFKIAGGLILLIMGVTTVLAINFTSKSETMSSAAILIGTPLLSGPGALTTIIILSKDYGYVIPGIAALLVLFVSFIILKSANYIQRCLGTEIIEILSKVLGLLLAALAVDFIHAGIVGFIA